MPNIKQIYVGTNLVRPKWEPGANTLAYYPLNTTTTTSDKSGNGYNLSNNGVTFTTLNGISCAYTSSGNYVTYQHSGTLCGTVRSFSIWLYIPITTTGWMGGLNYLSSSWGDYGTGGMMLGSGSTTSLNVADGATSSWFETTVTNGWNNVIVTQNNNIITMYINGAMVGTASNYPTSGSGTAPNCIRRGGKAARGVTADFAYTGYFNEFIIENKTRTAQEAADYYNITKGNYGL